MRRWDDAAEAGAGRPSPVSRDRLAERVRHDVADVRVRLEEAVLRGDALLAAGHPECAAAVIDEQQALMDELRGSVEASVVAAVVEAEAEAVLAGTPDADRMFGDELAPRRSVRTAASVLVSAVAAIAFMVMASTPPGPQTLAAAGVDDETPRDVGEAAALREAEDEDLRRQAEQAVDERAIGPNELEVRRLFSAPAPGDVGDLGPRVGLTAGLPDLHALVEQIIARVTRVAEGVGSEPVEEVREGSFRRDERRESSAETVAADESSSDAATADAPADEAAPESEDRPADGGDGDAGDDGELPGEDVVEDQVGGTGLATGW